MTPAAKELLIDKILAGPLDSLCVIDKVNFPVAVIAQGYEHRVIQALKDFTCVAAVVDLRAGSSAALTNMFVAR